MKFAFQIPFCVMEVFMKEEDIHFALAPLVLKYPEYRKMFRKMFRDVGNLTILDNGVHENGTPMDLDSLVNAYNLCGATVLIPPDRFWEMKFTLRSFHEARYRLPLTMLAPAVQGRTKEEANSCYTEYMLAGVSTVCIPYRLGALRKYLPYARDVNNHFLGMVSLEDLKWMHKIPNASVDTGKPFRYAQNQILWRYHDTDIKVPKLNMQGTCDIDFARLNIKYMKEWADGGE